ncbi:shikimate dehydrogenase [Rothia uropygialis]|uniref:shikimate dehydrogenase n=1 Tax=Kocuria sp. 36 TaxID=1415402 RepID=UPI001EE920B0|nr:shikimate dehydrogenase [Kocuria sp. 36]
MLRARGQMRLIETPDAPWAAVLGHPVAHSLSPVMHRAAYRVLGSEIEYTAADIEEETLADVVEPALRDGNWRGFSITMPLKSAACRFAGRLTEFAQTVGVINTLAPVGGADAQVVGHNTDVSGIVNALLRTGACTSQEPKAAIIGGGGTATAAVAALHVLGAARCTVFVRDRARAGRVVDVAGRLGMELDFRPLEEAAAGLSGFDLVVSTLPAHAFDVYAQSIQGDLSRTAVLDVSYDPWPSDLAQAISACGGTPVSGREMLLYQAVDQIKLFTGQSLFEALPSQEAVLSAMAEALGLTPRTDEPRLVCDDKLLRPRN